MTERHGFVRRVVFVGITTAGLGALVAAIVAIVAVDQLLVSQADQRLMGATIELAGELDEDPPEARANAVERELADENREIAPSGIELGVFQGKKQIAGLGSTRTPNVGKCETQGMLGVRTRSCAIPYGDWVLVASQRSDSPRLRWFYVLAALLACVTGATAGGGFGFKLAQWAIRPLGSITEKLRVVVPGKDTTFGSPSDCAEIEAVRCGIEDLLRRIQVLLAQAERFAADAAHELRSPLAALSIELELLAESLQEDDRAGVLRAHKRALGLSSLVERLLISALPTENLSHGFETVSMEDVVLAVINELPDVLREKTTFAPGTEGLVWGDSQLLRTLLLNAIENAHKHGNGDVVTLRVLEDETKVILQVADRGPGIPEEYRHKVFEPFFRIPGTAVEGHGLGLALIGHVALAHGGDACFVEQTLGGATLQVSLPAWSAKSAS